mgnify:CR=1 FL=1
MGDRGVIVVCAREGWFAYTDRPNEIFIAPHIYVHWHGHKSAIQKLLEESWGFVKRLQQSDPRWRQDFFIADPSMIASLITHVAWKLGYNPEIHQMVTPYPDRPPYIVITTTEGWYVTGGDFNPKYEEIYAIPSMKAVEVIKHEYLFALVDEVVEALKDVYPHL